MLTRMNTILLLAACCLVSYAQVYFAALSGAFYESKLLDYIKCQFYIEYFAS